MVLSRAENGDGPGWIATVEELPGCRARGATPESAAAAMTDAVDTWLREARATGREVPPPGAAAAAAPGHGLSLALKANLVVLAVAAAVAIALLITAWLG